MIMEYKINEIKAQSIDYKGIKCLITRKIKWTVDSAKGKSNLVLLIGLQE